jgi:hypothetical protein
MNVQSPDRLSDAMQRSTAYRSLAVLTARLSSGARRWLSRDGLVLLFFMLLALAAMHPVLPEPHSRIIGWPGDNIPFVYFTGTMAQALLEPHSPFVDPQLNYPDTLLLTATDLPFVSILAAAPATWLSGPIFGYNTVIWLCIWLSGYTAYLWIYHITSSRAAALVAGLAFLLTPYRVAHSYGHLQMVATWSLPLFFWALDNALRPTRPTRRGLFLLVGATFFVGGSSQYYLVICLLIGAVYGLMMVLPRPRYAVRYGWQTVASVGVGVALGSLPYLSNLLRVSYVPFDIHATRAWSADPLNFLLPSRLHPIWGSFFEQVRPEPLWIEKTLYIGIVAGVLALIALVKADTDTHPQHRSALQYRWVWGAMALVATLFALGTDLHINNQPLSADNPVWLPAYYVGQLPFISLMRSWSRFGIFTILFVALLAGLGTHYLLSRLHRHRWQLATLLSVLLIIDLLPGTVTTSRLAPQPVDLWLAQQPGDFVVAFLPANNSDILYPAMYGSLFHTRRMPAFAHRSHHPEAYRDFAQRAADFPAPHSIAALRQMGLHYLLLERGYFDGQYGPAWQVVEQQLTRAPDVSIVAEVGSTVVVDIR